MLQNLKPLFAALLFIALGIGLSAAPPNVVLIISDDQHWGDYGFMGHPTIQTPHWDRLSKEGLSFRRGYVPSSLCCPSLASIITGRYPHEHLIMGNDPPRPAGMKDAELYRLTDDPQEERNLADTETARVTSLRSKLDAWWPGSEAPR